jgi:hypothetical protein
MWQVVRIGKYFLTIMDPCACGRMDIPDGTFASMEHGTFEHSKDDVAFLVWDGHANSWPEAMIR